MYEIQAARSRETTKCFIELEQILGLASTPISRLTSSLIKIFGKISHFRSASRGFANCRSISPTLKQNGIFRETLSITKTSNLPTGIRDVSGGLLSVLMGRKFIASGYFAQLAPQQNSKLFQSNLSCSALRSIQIRPLNQRFVGVQR